MKKEVNYRGQKIVIIGELLVLKGAGYKTCFRVLSKLNDLGEFIILLTLLKNLDKKKLRFNLSFNKNKIYIDFNGAEVLNFYIKKLNI
jgi:hypothetical protein